MIVQFDWVMTIVTRVMLGNARAIFGCVTNWCRENIPEIDICIYVGAVRTPVEMIIGHEDANTLKIIQYRGTHHILKS